MADGNLTLDGELLQGGELRIPSYGVFIPTPGDTLEHAKPFMDIGNVEVLEDNPDLERVVHLDGKTQEMIGKAASWGVYFFDSSGLISDDFEFVGTVQYGGETASVRKSRVYGCWDFYVASELADGKEQIVVADGVVAPHWMGEDRVAVIDGIWHLREGDLHSKKALLEAIEHDVRADHRIIRNCHEHGITMDFLFYMGQGYRLMQGDVDERLDMAKVLHPNFNAQELGYK